MTLLIRRILYIFLVPIIFMIALTGWVLDGDFKTFFEDSWPRREK